MHSTMEKGIVCTLILSALPSSKASSWFSDAGQIVGDGWERGVRFVGLPLPATKGQHNCGDEVHYKDSELNKWNFHGVHSYYKCCEGYTRVGEYDKDCNKPLCSGWRNCEERGSCIRPGECSCNGGYTGRYTGCKTYSCIGRYDCGSRGYCAGPNQCTCSPGYSGSRNGCGKDINECLSSPCEQVCSNTYGSYQCSCKDGYEMKEGRCAIAHNIPDDPVDINAEDSADNFNIPGSKPDENQFPEIYSINPKPALKPWQIALIAGFGVLSFLLALVVVIVIKQNIKKKNKQYAY